ncbi:hypothetical protein L7F22_068757 [Adiantum nelumboides]|nr:hypothetical protein [Adiantum nelumboides]
MAEIHIVETSLVKPVTPTKHHALALNALDLYWSEFGYARTVHFYRIQPGHHDFKAIVQILKNSLSLLLVDFYPVAGRLVPHTAINSDDNIHSDHDSSLIVLDCNDSGVEFIEACCLDVDFGQLQQQGFRVQDFFARLTSTESRLRPEDPVMSVQVILCISCLLMYLHGQYFLLVNVLDVCISCLLMYLRCHTSSYPIQYKSEGVEGESGVGFVTWAAFSPDKYDAVRILTDVCIFTR